MVINLFKVFPHLSTCLSHLFPILGLVFMTWQKKPYDQRVLKQFSSPDAITDAWRCESFAGDIWLHSLTSWSPFETRWSCHTGTAERSKTYPTREELSVPIPRDVWKVQRFWHYINLQVTQDNMQPDPSPWTERMGWFTKQLRPHSGGRFSANKILSKWDSWSPSQHGNIWHRVCSSLGGN